MKTVTINVDVTRIMNAHRGHNYDVEVIVDGGYQCFSMLTQDEVLSMIDVIATLNEDTLVNYDEEIEEDFE